MSSERQNVKKQICHLGKYVEATHVKETEMSKRQIMPLRKICQKDRNVKETNMALRQKCQRERNVKEAKMSKRQICN